MSKRKGRSRAGTRQLFSKHHRAKGKISLTNYFMPYDVGDRVLLLAEPAIQKSLYHPRFHGKTGKVMAKRGECYELTIHDGGKEKMIIVHPVHMRKQVSMLSAKTGTRKH